MNSFQWVEGLIERARGEPCGLCGGAHVDRGEQIRGLFRPCACDCCRPAWEELLRTDFAGAFLFTRGQIAGHALGRRDRTLNELEVVLERLNVADSATSAGALIREV
jgi:hypothetical protein